MKLKSFIFDRYFFWICHAVLFSALGIVLWQVKFPIGLIGMLAFAWFFPLYVYVITDYLRKRYYYKQLVHYNKTLDEKYLLPELVDEPSFLEGELVHFVLLNANRQMHEKVNDYKRELKSYQEYIETWVHEIKAPIATTRLIVENHGEDNSISDEMDIIERYVEQVLYYAKSNFVNEDYIVHGFMLEEAVNKVLQRNARAFIYNKIQLKLGNLDVKVYSDSKWVEFILNQIIVNAINYNQNVHKEIKIDAEVYKNQVVLKIEDTGIGIDAKDLSRVFEKGFTGDNGRVFRKSTGMGLYLCKKLSEKLHLGLTIHSSLDIGTKVAIVFPLNQTLLMQD